MTESKDQTSDASRTGPSADEERQRLAEQAERHQSDVKDEDDADSDLPKATPTADPNVDPANDWPSA